MKVIFANRKTCFSQRGGDTVQMEKTKEYLEKLYPDIQIAYALSPEDILNDNEAEILHIFNMTNLNETLAYIKAAKQKNKKIALSTIYCQSLDEIYVRYMNFFKIYGLSLPDFVKKLIIYVLNVFVLILSLFIEKYKSYNENNCLYLFPKSKRLGREILENSDILLPNSDIEGNEVSKYYNCDIKNKTHVVPNATEFFKHILNSNSDTDDQNLPDNYVLEVGRVEIRKNQLNVIKALYNSPEIPIVIIGQTFKDNYCKTVKELAEKRGNVIFFERIPDIQSVYSKAAVNVLPSFMETTGLTSIEAKAMGAQIVVSDNRYCPIKYYKFDEYGFTCNPYDINSIKEAILNAYNNPKNAELTDEYKNFFSYENVAKMTYEAYQKILE